MEYWILANHSMMAETKHQLNESKTKTFWLSSNKLYNNNNFSYLSKLAFSGLK